jgi:hypothetical protein
VYHNSTQLHQSAGGRLPPPEMALLASAEWAARRSSGPRGRRRVGGTFASLSRAGYIVVPSPPPSMLAPPPPLRLARATICGPIKVVASGAQARGCVALAPFGALSVRPHSCRLPPAASSKVARCPSARRTVSPAAVVEVGKQSCTHQRVSCCSIGRPSQRAERTSARCDAAQAP